MKPQRIPARMYVLFGDFRLNKDRHILEDGPGGEKLQPVGIAKVHFRARAPIRLFPGIAFDL